MRKRLPRGVAPAAVALGLVLVAVLGYLLLISPQRSKASRLGEEIEATRQAIATAHLLRRNQPKRSALRVTDVLRLTKAIPDQTDMAGVMLELNQVARETGMTFASIAPQVPITLSGYRAVPITVVFEGNFFSLADFLYRLRSRVRVEGGKLDATGRLFLIDSIDLGEGSGRFPHVQALMTIDAFVSGGAEPAPASAPAPVPADPSVELPSEATAAGAP